MVLIAVATLLFGPLAGAAPQITPAERARAKAHFERGKAAFEAKDFETAIKEYEQAHKIMPLPGLLFNIAQCYRNLRRNAEAAALFRRYLDAAPDAPNRAAVERLIKEIEAEVAAAPPPPPPKKEPEVQKQPVLPPVILGESPSPEDEKPEAAIEPIGQAPSLAEAGITSPTPGVSDQRDEPSVTPLYTRWWFWTAVGVVVAGGVTATLLATLKGSPDVAPSRFPTWQLPDLD